MVPFKDQMILLKQFDQRTQEKFKPELVGNGQICLNSKVYHTWNDTDEKTRCNGVQKRRNHLVCDDFLSVIETQKAKQFENAGSLRRMTVLQDSRALKHTQTKQRF